MQEQEHQQQHVNSPEYRYAQHVVNEASRLGMRFGLHGEGGLQAKGARNWAHDATRTTNGNFRFGQPIDAGMIKLCLEKQARVPFDVLLLRPFMEYEMSSGVMMKGGYETGATFVGHSVRVSFNAFFSLDVHCSGRDSFVCVVVVVLRFFVFVFCCFVIFSVFILCLRLFLFFVLSF